MKRNGVIIAVLVLFGALLGWSQSSDPGPAAAKTASAWGMMKMRVFEGLREGATEPVKVVTASYLNYAVTASIQSEADAAAQEAKLKQIFNLKGVSLLTEADLVWDKGRSEKAFHFFRLGDKDYLVLVTPIDIPKLRFRIEVFEQKNAAKTNLLDTEFTVAPKNTAVFGFSAADGKPYFISMQTIKWPSEVDAQIILGSDAVAGEGPVRAIGNIKPPRLVKMADPVYPEIARKSRVEGVVILEAQTDIYGRVQNIKILRSIPLLDQAAIDSVRQWVYEPKIIDGKPRSVIFTVTVRFQFGEKSGTKSGAPFPKEEMEKLQKLPPVKAEGKIQPPALMKQVDPVYPEDARAAGVEGIVILEAQTDIYGRVESVKVLRSIPGLDKAAIDAVRQWVYEPLMIEGKPRRCIFTVTVRFTLK